MSISHEPLGPDHHLTVDNVAKIAKNKGIKVAITSRAMKVVGKSRLVVEEAIFKKKIIYGLTTGFGHFKDKFIDSNKVKELQENLIVSHCVGVGELLDPTLVRASMVVRLNSLLRGFSGVRPVFVSFLAEVINKNILPLVPSQGSVGSSGDLAPLSHIGAVLIGRGKALSKKGKIVSGRAALKEHGLRPLEFEAKEGLAFNNGTAVMTGIAAIALARAKILMNVADIATALTLEAVCGESRAFDKSVHDLRPHPGQIVSASNVRKVIDGSKLIASVADRIQDSYSLRCAPQVNGAVRDSLKHVEGVVEIELNSTTDNPLVFADRNVVISGGNFHGEPVAIAMDLFGIAISELANISERRTAKLLDANNNEGLPMFLISDDKAGLHNGLMMIQYTAAALVSENKVLAHPASVDSIPTSANQEDHVSMGTIAARKALKIIENAENVLAIELISAAQAIDFRGPQKLGKISHKAYKIIREKVKRLEVDRELSPDINNVRKAFTNLSALI